jgi:hypothetical protein
VDKGKCEFTSTSMEANNVEASEATQMATFTPEMKKPGKFVQTGSTKNWGAFQIATVHE